MGVNISKVREQIVQVTRNSDYYGISEDEIRDELARADSSATPDHPYVQIKIDMEDPAKRESCRKCIREIIVKSRQASSSRKGGVMNRQEVRTTHRLQARIYDHPKAEARVVTQPRHVEVSRDDTSLMTACLLLAIIAKMKIGSSAWCPNLLTGRMMLA